MSLESNPESLRLNFSLSVDDKIDELDSISEHTDKGVGGYIDEVRKNGDIYLLSDNGLILHLYKNKIIDVVGYRKNIHVDIFDVLGRYIGTVAQSAEGDGIFSFRIDRFVFDRDIYLLSRAPSFLEKYNTHKYECYAFHSAALKTLEKLSP